MHGKERKGITYYACCYRIAYGDKAAEALGHGKWQYVREDILIPAIDSFFATNIFGPQRIHHLRAQHADLGPEIATEDTQEHEQLRERIADVQRRIELQIRAIEAGVEPTLVTARIEALKHEQHDLERALTTSERSAASRPHLGDGLARPDICAVANLTLDNDGAPQLEHRGWLAVVRTDFPRPPADRLGVVDTRYGGVFLLLCRPGDPPYRH